MVRVCTDLFKSGVGNNILAEIPEQEFNNLAKRVIRICKELLQNKKFTNEGDLDTRIRRYEDRSNPLMRFIEENCDEELGAYIPLKDFSKSLNDYLKDNRLRQITPIKISRELKNEGFNVSAKKIPVGDDIINTIVVFSIKIKEEYKNTIGTHPNPLESQLVIHGEGKVRKEWVPMGSNGLNNDKQLDFTKEELEKAVYSDGDFPETDKLFKNLKKVSEVSKEDFENAI